MTEKFTFTLGPNDDRKCPNCQQPVSALEGEGEAREVRATRLEPFSPPATYSVEAKTLIYRPCGCYFDPESGGWKSAAAESGGANAWVRGPGTDGWQKA